MARLAMVNYLAQTGRRDVAEARLAELARDYPSNIEILRTRTTLMAVSPTDGSINPNGVAAADLLIKKFINEFPGDKAARLYYAEWLVKTKRAEQAVEFLKDPATFPGGRDLAVNRALAAAMVRAGQREEAEKILSQLPIDAGLDAVLVQAAATREASDRQIRDALGRYENQGLFRLYDAAMRLSEGKFEEAIRKYASATEFTQFGKAAKQGIQRALFAYAEADPVRAREEAIRLAGEIPDEPGIVLAAAYAAMIMDEIGSLEDKWEQTKTMYACLSKWETLALKSGLSKPDTTLTRAQFRYLIGDIDGAKREIAASVAQFPQHLASLFTPCDMTLVAPADPTRARELYNLALKEDPNNRRLPYLDARIKEVSGDWAGAVAVYEGLTGGVLKDATPYIRLIAALSTQNKNDEALKWARAWNAAMPEDPRTTSELIRLLATTGNKPEAMKVADDCVLKQVAETRKRLSEATTAPTPAQVEKMVDEARAQALLLGASSFTMAKMYDEAESRLAEVRKTFPTADRPILMLGDIATAKKDWPKAEGYYRELIKQNNQNFIAANNLAWILAEIKNDPNAALALVEEVRKGKNGTRPISPERFPVDFLDTLGVIYTKLNRSDRLPEMRITFEAAVKRYPNDPRMFLYLAQSQAGLGEKFKALENLDSAIRLANQKNALTAEQNKSVLQGAEALRAKLRG